MAFGNINVFYLPEIANTGASLWGTDVQNLLSAADPPSDNNTVTDHGTGGATVRTLDPYSTKATDDTQANFGWAITPSDMNSVSGARRYFGAGNHTVSIRTACASATAVNGTLFMYVYRVGNAGGGRARTLLGSNSATVAYPAAFGQVTASVSVNLAEVIFEADETIQYSFEMSLTGQITGMTATFWAGTESGVAARVNTPTLKVLADTTGTATGSGTADGVTGKVLGTIGTTTGLGTATGSMSSRADTVGTASGSVTVTGVGAARADTVGTATGLGTATGIGGKVIGTIGTVTIGGGGGGTTIINKPTYIFDD